MKIESEQREKDETPPPKSSKSKPEELAVPAYLFKSEKNKQKPKIHEVTVNTNKEDVKKLVTKLNNYIRLFPNEAHNVKLSRNPTAEQVQEHIDTISHSVKSRKALHNAKKIDLLTHGLIENIGVNFKMPLYGLHQLAQDTQVLVEDELKELSIIYEDWLVFNPLWAYFMHISDNVINVMKSNMEIKSGKPKTTNQPSKSVQTKIDDYMNKL